MIFIVVPLLIVIGIIIYDLKEWQRLGIETFLKYMVGILSGIVVAFLLWVFICSVYSPTTSISSTETCEIIALTDNETLSGSAGGSIFMAQGRINEKLQYRYLYEIEGKGLAFGSVDADNSFINYTTDTPHLVIQHYDYDNALMRWLFLNYTEPDYIFYIPTDSQIIDDYIIDLE